MQKFNGYVKKYWVYKKADEYIKNARRNKKIGRRKFEFRERN